MNIDAPESSRRPSIAENFRGMPGWLKLMTAHALFCFVLVLGVLIPRRTPALGKSGASFEQWWASDGGALAAAAMGLVMTTAGVLFLLRRGFGRHLYLGIFAGALVGVHLYQGRLGAAVFGAIIVGALGAYLFRNDSIRAYFDGRRHQGKSMRVGNAIPIASLAILAVGALYLWSISDQPRMADGGLTGDEMSAAEMVLTMTATLSVFASMFVAMRRAVRAGSWFWFLVCLFVWPATYAYALLVNRNDA